jgi:predicted O-linked N-acetylglucosamine transferase (SPINDLY family)
MGVPPICLAGNTHAGRLGVSLLTNLGLTQFIARDYAEYVEIAQRLAENPSELTHLRATMRERMRNSPLMNPRKLARDVEALYRQAWRKWCNS